MVGGFVTRRGVPKRSRNRARHNTTESTSIHLVCGSNMQMHVELPDNSQTEDSGLHRTKKREGSVNGTLLQASR